MSRFLRWLLPEEMSPVVGYAFLIAAVLITALLVLGAPLEVP